MSTSSPPEAWSPLVRAARLAARPIERFLRVEAASGIVLLVAAAVALVLANSPWAADVASFRHTPIGLRFGEWSFERPLEWFVNDALMVVFFFVVKPLNVLEARRKRGEEPVEPEQLSDEAALLTEIRDLLAAESGQAGRPAGQSPLAPSDRPGQP